VQNLEQSFSMQGVQNPQKNGQFLFEFKSVDDDIKLSADRISSLMSQLIGFYQFLQEFGIKFKGTDRVYSAQTAVKSQKNLENATDNILESLQILNVILQKVKHDKQLGKIQTILFEQNIPQLLMEIQKLTYQMCFKKTENYQTSAGNQYKQSQFGIASNNLLDAITSLWDFFLSYCNNNQPFSQYILQYDEVLG